MRIVSLQMKAAQMNMKCCLIQEFMFYKFKLRNKIIKISKKICFVKGEGTVDHSTVSRWFKKFCSACKTLDNQAKSDEPKSMDSEANLAVEIQIISIELGIWLFSVVCHLHNVSKRVWSYWILLHITKILLNFWL